MAQRSSAPPLWQRPKLGEKSTSQRHLAASAESLGTVMFTPLSCREYLGDAGAVRKRFSALAHQAPHPEPQHGRRKDGCLISDLHVLRTNRLSTLRADEERLGQLAASAVANPHRRAAWVAVVRIGPAKEGENRRV